MRWLLKFHKSHVCFISIQGQLNSHLPGKSGAHFVTVQNNSVLKDAEKITLCFLNITRVSSSRIWVYWVWKLIFKCLSNLRITNNFSLQWSQIPHFLDFHFISYKTNMKKLLPFFPITGPHSLSCTYWFISTKRLLNEGDESWSIVTSLLQEVTTNTSYHPCLNCCWIVCFSHLSMETSGKSFAKPFALFKAVKFCLDENMSERCGPEQSSGHLIQVTH